MADSTVLKTQGDLPNLTDIQEDLECVICLDIPNCNPVFQCNNGHMYCSSCHEKITDCAVCRIKLGYTRCLMAEKILAKCPRLCTFNSYGCNERLTEEPLKVHEDLCTFRPVQCPINLCDFSGANK